MTELSETLEALRAYMQLTHSDMVDLLQVSRPTYNKWISGQAEKIQQRHMERIALVSTNLIAIAKSPEWQSATREPLTKVKRREILNALWPTTS